MSWGTTAPGVREYDVGTGINGQDLLTYLAYERIPKNHVFGVIMKDSFTLLRKRVVSK